MAAVGTSQPNANPWADRSAQKVGDAVRLVGASGIECSLPYCDLAVAHDPDFNAEAAHGGARLGVLPFTFPDADRREARSIVAGNFGEDAMAMATTYAPLPAAEHT